MRSLGRIEPASPSLPGVDPCRAPLAPPKGDSATTSSTAETPAPRSSTSPPTTTPSSPRSPRPPCGSPCGVLAYCLMPNHFHIVAWPVGDGDLSRWMHWLTTAHVRRYLAHYRHSGHIWQGRYKAFPAQDDGHLLTALRYVERNALLRRARRRAPRIGRGRASIPAGVGIRPAARSRPGAAPRRLGRARQRGDDARRRRRPSVRRSGEGPRWGASPGSARRRSGSHLGFTLRGRDRPPGQPPAQPRVMTFPYLS